MIELLFLIGAMGAINEIAKKRGASGWPYVVAGVLGWFFAGTISAAALGPGPNIFFAWGWVGLCYAAVFLLTGDGRRLPSSWQCPQCRMFNDPTTLICPCGQPAEGMEDLVPNDHSKVLSNEDPSGDTDRKPSDRPTPPAPPPGFSLQ